MLIDYICIGRDMIGRNTLELKRKLLLTTRTHFKGVKKVHHYQKVIINVTLHVQLTIVLDTKYIFMSDKSAVKNKVLNKNSVSTYNATL